MEEPISTYFRYCSHGDASSLYADTERHLYLGLQCNGLNKVFFLVFGYIKTRKIFKWPKSTSII